MTSNTRAHRASKGNSSCCPRGTVRSQSQDELNSRLADVILKNPPGKVFSCREISRQVGCATSTVTLALESAFAALAKGLAARGVTRTDFEAYMSMARNQHLLSRV